MIIEATLCLSMELKKPDMIKDMLEYARQSEEKKFQILTEEEKEKEMERMFRLLLDEVNRKN